MTPFFGVRSPVSGLVVVVLAGAALAVGAGRAAAQDAQEARGVGVLEATAERYAQSTTLCADFEQRLEIPLLGDERTGSGRLCQSNPDRFTMRFSDPEGDRIVVDGESVWVYYPSVDEKQVFRFAMAERAGGYDLHREFLERPRAKYEVTYEAEEAVMGRRTHRLRLVPRARTTYRAATVWIDVGVPVLRRIRIEEDNESVRTVSLDNVAFDPTAVPAEWFTFTPPPGAQVIDGR